jgi:hypothetical protein
LQRYSKRGFFGFFLNFNKWFLEHKIEKILRFLIYLIIIFFYLEVSLDIIESERPRTSQTKPK